MKDIAQALYRAKRPVLIYGWGVHLAGAEDLAVEVAHRLGIPVALTWGARDLFPHEDALCVGGFGTHGTRAANFVVQNADFILSVGSRLDSKATGTPTKWFAREAPKFMVDIDQHEIEKMSRLEIPVVGIQQDAKIFLSELNQFIYSIPANDGQLPDWLDWQLRCSQYMRDYPADSAGGPYTFITELSKHAKPDDIIVCDTGCVLAWTMQCWRVKQGQRFIHAYNQTPMGYGLPAAIGAHYATGKRIILLAGDGSIMVNIGELATVCARALPVKVFVFDNAGHAMCRQTQREWLGGVYPATSIPDLSFPHWRRIALGFGLWSGDGTQYQQALDREGPGFIHYQCDPDADVVPKVRFGKPNEDGEPFLPRDEFLSQMIVPPVQQPERTG